MSDRAKKKQKVAAAIAPAPDVDLHRNALMGARGLMKARLYQHLKTAGDIEDPTQLFAKQMIASLKAIYVHVITARTDVGAFGIKPCEDLLESLAYSLVYGLKVEPGAFCDISYGSDCFDFMLDPADADASAHRFTGSFHRPLLWVWRELLLMMILLEKPEEDVVDSVRTALLASPLYDCRDWREAPRHTIDLLLRGGREKEWDKQDHLKDAATAAQKQCLPRLIALCKSHKEDFKYDKYDTYEFNNNEEDVHQDTDDDHYDDDEEEDDDEEDNDSGGW